MFADFVKEATSSTGLGSYILAGVTSTQFQSFATAGLNGETVKYLATDGSDSEVGEGVFTSGPDTLTRDTIEDSTNGGAAVNWTVSPVVGVNFPASSANASDGLTLLSTTTLSADTSKVIDWSNPELYSEIHIVYNDITVTVDENSIILQARQSATTRTGASDYGRQRLAVKASTVVPFGTVTSDVWSFLGAGSTSNWNLSNAAGHSLGGKTIISNPGGTSVNTLQFSNIVSIDADSQVRPTIHTGALTLNTNPVDGVELTPTGGGTFSGTVYVYGLLK